MQRMLTLLLVAWAVLAQAQAPVAQLDITADELLGGNADQALQDLGARAAAESLVVTVTAPAYWQELVAEQLNAGGEGLEIQFRETIIESVIVRLNEPGAGAPAVVRPAPSEPAPAQSSGPVGPAPEAPELETEDVRLQAEEALREQARATVSAGAQPEISAHPSLVEPTLTAPIAAPPPGLSPADAQETVAEDSFQAGTPEPAPVEPAAAEVPEEEAPAVEQAPASVASVQDAPAAQPAAPAEATEAGEETDGGSEEAARASLERRLNRGRSIDKSLSVGQLRRGDQLFRTGDLVVVVRSSRLGRNFYWLEGELDLDEHPDVRRLQAGKYEVLERLEAEDDPSVAVEAGETEAGDPAPAGVDLQSDQVMDERTEMEARYNGGRPVESTVSVSGLRPDDILYVGDTLVMVVRRDRVSLKRYWLEGTIDLEREELERQGNRKYRVRRQIR